MKRALLVVVAGLVLSACNYSTPAPSAPSSGSMEPVIEQIEEAATNTWTVPLTAQNNSGQNGVMTLTESDGQVTAVLAMTGGSFTAPQPAHIHVGACPTPGAVKWPLNNVVNGASTTVLDVTLADLKAAGPLAVNVHKSAQESSNYTSCGDLK